MERQQVPGARLALPARAVRPELDHLVVVIVQIHEDRRQILGRGSLLGGAAARRFRQQIEAEDFARGVLPGIPGRLLREDTAAAEKRRQGKGGGSHREEKGATRSARDVSSVRVHSSTFAMAWRLSRLR